MMADRLEQRHLGALLACDKRAEGGRLGDRHPHVEADRDQHGAGEEGHAPGPGDEALFAQAKEQQQEQAVGEQETDRRPELREHAEPGASALRRVLGREQRRSAPFAAKADPLTEAQQAEQPRRERAGRGVARQDADQRCRQAHGQHRRHQRRLAADAVAEMAKQHGADRAGEKSDAKGQEGVERLRLRRRLRKERLADHQRRGGSVDVKIIEFDRRADQARQHDAPDAQLRRRRSGPCRLRHPFPPSLTFSRRRPARTARAKLLVRPIDWRHFLSAWPAWQSRGRAANFSFPRLARRFATG